MNQSEDRWTVRGITEEVRRDFVANCYRLGFPAGVVLMKIMRDLSDVNVLREYLEDEISIRDIMDDAKDAMKDPLGDLPAPSGLLKGLPRF